MNVRRFLSFLALAALLPAGALAHEDLTLRISALTGQMRTNGESSELLLQRAELYRLHQDFPSALRDYDAAARGLTNSAALDFGRAQTLAASGNLADARVVFDRLLQRQPTNAPALLGRAAVLAQLNQPAPAIADYSLAFQQSAAPRPEDYLERARLQSMTTGPAAAVNGLDEGLSRLGWTLTLQRAAVDYDLACVNTTSALARLETILIRSHRQESWLALKGEILQQAGRTTEARESYQSALNTMSNLPPRLAGSGLMVTLRTRIETDLTSLSRGATNAVP